MPEVLAELVAKITADATELKKGLTGAEKDLGKTGKTLKKETKSWQDQFKAVGKLALGMGASITAAMTTAIMSFTSVGSELHDLSLKTGVSAKALAGLQYAAEQNGASLGTVEMAIRRTASAMQDAKDGLTETQRAFARMGLSLVELEGLNPEEQFMKMAEAIADIPDPMTRAATAQDLFGRSGMDMLPMLSEGADGLKRMMEEGQKLTGWTDEGIKSADALGDTFNTLKTSTMGVFNAIGSALAPTLKDLIDKIMGVVKGITGWIKEYPALTKQIGLLSIALGGFLTLAGTLMMIAPAIAAAWAVAMGPVGWITLAIAGLIAAGVLLWQNWDKIANVFRSDASKIKHAAQEMTGALKTELEKQKADALATYATQKATAQSLYDNNIRKIKEEYGVYESTSKDKQTIAKAISEATKRALDDELEQAKRVHDDKMDLLEREYDQKIRTLNAESDAQISAIQTQIDAIDKQTEKEDLILTRRAEKKRLKELTGIEYRKYAAEVARNELLRQRDAEKDALRDTIDIVRTQTQNEVDRLQTELEANKTWTNEILGLTQERVDRETSLLDLALQGELKRLDDERIAKEALEKQKLDATLTTLTNEETSIKASFDARLTEAALYQASLEAVLKDVNQIVTTTYLPNSKGGEGLIGGGIIPSPSLSHYATGGIVGGSPGEPQLAMVHGGETILPEGSGNTIINVKVTGSVISEYDLTEIIRRRLLLGKMRNFNTGL